MSGICGFVGIRDEALLDRMIDSLAVRGPHTAGKMFRGGDFALGYRGLNGGPKTAGSQPSYNENESICVVCDGEILNRRDLRERLEAAGHTFSADSGAETIAHAYEEHGIGCIDRFLGEFAFALWDYDEYRLIIARDRAGAKPLYYHLSQDMLLFASNIAALRRHGGRDWNVDLRGLDNYLAFGYVPGERTFFEDIRRLPPGHMMVCRRGAVRLSPYWKPEFHEERRREGPEWLEEFTATLKNTIGDRAADGAPLGVETCGRSGPGAIISIARKLHGGPLNTRSARFADAEHEPESETNLNGHRTILVSPLDFDRLPATVETLDEPAADLPLLLIDRLFAAAADESDTILAGAGLEEILGACHRHSLFMKVHRRLKLTPEPLKPFAAMAARLAPQLMAGPDFELSGLGGREGSLRLSASISGTARPASLFERLFSLFTHSARLRLYSPGIETSLAGYLRSGPDAPLQQSIRKHHTRDLLVSHEILSSLPGRVLPRLDRIAALHGIHVHTPFLDHRLIELAIHTPASFDSEKSNPFSELLSFLNIEAGADTDPPRPATAGRRACALIARALNPTFDEYLSAGRIRSRGWLLPSAVDSTIKNAQKGCPVSLKQAFSLAVLEMWCVSHLD